MSIRSDLLNPNPTYLKLDADVRIGGTLVLDVIEIQVSAGVDQTNAESTIICTARPSSAEEGQPVTVRAGYNGELPQIFGGEVVGIDWETWAPRIGVRCRDLLARTRLPWGGLERTYSNQDDAVIIRNVLEAYGVPAADAVIESSGKVRGTIQDVVLATGDTGWSLIERLDRLVGYRTFTAPNGMIYRRRVSGGTGATAAWTFDQAIDLLRAKRTRDATGICNQMTVTGLSYEGTEVTGSASALNPYVPSPPGFIADEIQDDLVETNADAIEIAQREVGDRNRRPEGADVEVLGNPLLQPAMTTGLNASDLEVTNGLTFLLNLKHSIVFNPPQWTTSARLSGGTLSGYNAAAPIAQFSLELFLEAEDTGSGISGVIVAVADGGSSFDPDGTEDGLTYSWTISAVGGASSKAAQVGGTVCRFTLPAAATSVTVGLLVTDPDGLTGSTSLTRTIIPAELPVEDLSTAEGALVAYSSDGQQTWQEPALPSGVTSSCLAEFAPDWGQLWGASNGRCYATFDAGATLIDLGQPLGTATAITAVWVHELSTTRLWAANAAGAVAFGELDLSAKTVSWSARGSIGSGPVTAIRESISQFGALAALAGQGYYQSSDSAGTWTLLDSGDMTSRLADGFGRNAYTFLNDDRPLRIVGAADPTFPVLDPPVRHVRGVTFGWRIDRLYCADNQGRLFAGDPPTYDMQLVGTTPAIVNHMQRSGNEDGVIYLAVGDGADNAGGILKWIPEA